MNDFIVKESNYSIYLKIYIKKIIRDILILLLLYI
jgi:hypothetical protein